MKATNKVLSKMTRFNLAKYRNSISVRLLGYVLCASSGVTTLTTAVQLSFDYHQELNLIDRDFGIVEHSHLNALTHSIWNLDEFQIRTQVDGLLRLPSLSYVRIATPAGDEVAVSGARPTGRTSTRTFQLRHDSGESLGTLEVYADESPIVDKLIRKALLVFVTQLIKTLLVMTVVFLIFRRVLTVHLLHITQYLRQFAMDPSAPPLILNRPPLPQGKQDELDVLTKAINRLRNKLHNSLDELRHLNQSLENKVESKTLQLMEQREKLEISSRLSSLGEMAGGIAHEINTPLSIITLYSEQTLEMLDSGESPEEIKENLNAVLETTERISKIVRALRVVARDGSSDSFEKGNIKLMLEDAHELCREKLKFSGAPVHNIRTDQDFFIDCRPVQITQVMLNLLANSVDAISELPEKWIELKLEEKDGFAFLSVTDSGNGIPKEIAARIMDPFFTTKPVGKGTGLGLSLCRGIIENHGGEFFVDHDCANTRFVVKLPIRQAAKASNEAA